MTETGTGWPGPEFPEHANVKLTAEQKAKINESGDPESTWIRQAIVERLEREEREEYEALVRKHLAAGRSPLAAKVNARADQLARRRALTDQK